jgi:myo-inositol 2-dehydrogenase/D-chiro-inositol 1-dehydrogenase
VTGDLLAHNIDTAMWLNGPITEVSAVTETFIKERKHNLTGQVEPVGIDDASLFICRFENGSPATFEATRYARGHKALYTLEINGEHASAFWQSPTTSTGSSTFDHKDEGRVRGWRNVHITDGDHPRHEALVGSGTPDRLLSTPSPINLPTSCRQLGEGKSSAPTFRDGLATDRVTDAVLKSAKSRRWESV